MVSEDVDAALAVEAAGAAAGAAALDEGAGVAVAAAGASLPEAAFVAVCPGVAAGAALALPPRKSVTYQPEPFNWNPAAVTCLVNVGAPHAGQTLSWGSDIF